MTDRKGLNVSPAPDGEALPLTLTPEDVGTRDLASWMRSHPESVSAELQRSGAILFRDFPIDETSDFERIVATLSASPIDYVFRSTPRTHIGGNIYTSTEYLPGREILLHNENSYQDSWPMKIIFYCQQPATSGGQTPIARTVDVTNQIDDEIIGCFAEKNIMYVRNYYEDADLSWQSAFQTDNKDGVERYCREHGIEFVWRPDGHLVTKRIAQAFATHPENGKRLWFNQAHLFHVSSLPQRTKRASLSHFGEAGLPRNCYYGDGTPIPEDFITKIRHAYKTQIKECCWRQGDVLMLDNMLVCHGRYPYSGDRKVFVAMVDPHPATS